MRQAEEPLTKVTLNLFSSDVEWFKAHYPNYTEAIRTAVRQARSRKIIDYQLQEDYNARDR